MRHVPRSADNSKGSFLSPFARIVLLVAVILVGGAVAWGVQGGPRTSSAIPRVGGSAPAFSLQDTNGRTASLAGVRGQPVILNFWATWCPPCKAEMPAISAVSKAHPNMVVLAVDVLEGPELVQSYVSTMNLGFTPVLDPAGSVAGRYHVSSLPTSFFIGPDGTIRAINIGPMDQSSIEQNLQRAQS